ncbi:Pyridoxamine 5'-phosphate oxidase [Mariniphaga anaerophila]|uniref:Pyridoxine/pyridoxamine 5'-phosphate oxidase n=1 Tax=Mariniphaga anaerophila TaxID=1484053 RepID=A0A1M4SI33_9BACT|nr:pyridoxamine 5'-phosphate oxidase [Mariniphaga anaerophila]SHE31647.1 Pyridoxamine 5'-phosphate oxidase [Mariniphaga anaerophila]
MKIDSIRNEYSFSGLRKQNTDDNPFNQFEKWLKEAIDSNEKEPTAMAVATIGTDGFPQSRIVLLKYFNENGFVFFTNYLSGKGRSIESSPAVGLHFFWPLLERQVRISGVAEKTSKKVSEKYFHSRPLESQVGAWASEQSKEIESRDYLEQRFRKFSSEFENEAPSLPPFWGGYNVVPQKIEFWQGRENRLHDRILYKKLSNNEWEKIRLAP